MRQGQLTDEHEVPSRRHRHGWMVDILKDVLKYVVFAALGAIVTLVLLSARLRSWEKADREWRYIYCNGMLPPRARAIVEFCRDVPEPKDPTTYRRFFRDTT